MPNVPSRSFLALLLAPLLAAPLRAQPLPASVTVLTREDFGRLNYYSLADMLDQAVGIDVERTGYRGTISHSRLRGFSETQQMIIAIDGRPITHSFDGAANLAAIPTNMVERIEITRGGAPIMYGPAAAGLVNIVTARPERKNWTVDLETNVGRDGVRQHNGRFFDRFWLGDATYVAGLQDSGGFTRNDQAEQYNHFGNVTRSFSKGGYLGVEYSYIEGFSGTPDGSTVPFDQWNDKEEQVVANPTGRHDYELQTARLLGSSPKIGGGTFFADVTQSLTDSKFMTAPSGGTLLQDQDNDTVEGRLRWEHRLLTLGVETNDFKRRLQGAEKRTASQSGAFLQSQAKMGKLEASGGVRVDEHSRAGSGVSGRLSTIFRPIDATAFSLSAQSGSRFPTFEEIFPAAGPAADLDPERVNSLDAGLAYEGTGYRLAVTGFETRVKDAIGFDPATGANGNVGEGRSHGVEIEAAVMFGEGAWRQTRLSGNYTTRKAEQRDAGMTDFALAPLSSKRLAFARLEYLLPWKITMTNEMRYQSEQFEFTGRTGRRLPPFGIWNLKFTINIWSAQAYLIAENLGGRRYAEAFGPSATPTSEGLEPQPTRTFWTGVSIRFLK